jgi:hypothetical protein
MLDMLLEEMAVEKVAGVDKQAALAMLDEMSDHQLVATYETVVPAEEREKEAVDARLIGMAKKILGKRSRNLAAKKKAAGEAAREEAKRKAALLAGAGGATVGSGGTALLMHGTEGREKASFVIPGIKRVTTGGLAQKARAALKSSLKVKKVKKVKMAAKANAAVAVPPPKVKPLSKAGKGFTAPKVSKSALSPYPDAAPKLTWA